MEGRAGRDWWRNGRDGIRIEDESICYRGGEDFGELWLIRLPEREKFPQLMNMLALWSGRSKLY